MPTPKVKRNTYTSPSVTDIVDLLIEILLRLPVISLVRFQVVSQLWRSIISDPSFQSKHTLLWHNSCHVISGLYYRSLNYVGLSLAGSGRKNALPSLSFLGSEFIVQQHCKGLLLCRNRKRLVVCNPTTNKYREFRLLDDLLVSSLNACLAFDPSESLEFKVVVPTSFGFGIFSSNSHKASWQHVEIASTLGWSFFPSLLYQPVFCKGAIYWRHKSRSCLVRFDMVSHQLSLTPSMSQWKYIHYIGECNGNLILLVSSSFGNYELVMPEVDGERRNKWIVRSSINVQRVELFASGGRVVVMSVSTDASGEDFKVVLAFANSVYCYSWKMNTVNVVLDLPDASPRNSNSFSYRNVYEFSESLAPV